MVNGLPWILVATEMVLSFDAVEKRVNSSLQCNGGECGSPGSLLSSLSGIYPWSDSNWYCLTFPWWSLVCPSYIGSTFAYPSNKVGWVLSLQTSSLSSADRYIVIQNKLPQLLGNAQQEPSRKHIKTGSCQPDSVKTKK